jgi:alkylation response protein AidB-like acyl-CoA dehydrogenase
MDFGLNADQDMLAKYAREFLTNECPTSFARRMMEDATAHDPAFYKKMADLGWMGIAVPEAYGGQGMGYVDLAVLLEEMGRALVPGPFFASVCMAAVVIGEAAGDEQKARLLGPIATGEGTATLAHTEAGGELGPQGIQMAARADGNSFLLNGTKRFVLDAHVADTLVVAVRTSEDDSPQRGISLLAVDSSSDGVSVSQLRAMDMTRRLCDVTFEGVRVGSDSLLGEVDRGWLPLERALHKSAALLSAECVGGAQQVLDLSVAYAKERVQFGRPIGSFQAIKHKCADMLVDVELGRSAMYFAAWAAATDDEELALSASMAKAYCGEAYSRVASDGIHVHGGIGFTWEHDMHLYFKRAKTNEVLLGDPAYHREQVARLVAA